MTNAQQNYCQLANVKVPILSKVTTKTSRSTSEDKLFRLNV